MNKTPLYQGHRQRLRERFINSGLKGFADYEVVDDDKTDEKDENK